VKGVIGLTVKYVYDEEAIRHISHIADPKRVMRPGNPRQKVQERYHGIENWAKVLLNNRALFQSFFDAPPIGDAAMRSIATPVLLLSGEQDPLVPVKETRISPGSSRTRGLGSSRPSAPVGAGPQDPVKHAVLNFVAEVGERPLRSSEEGGGDRAAGGRRFAAPRGQCEASEGGALLER
jgi:pimeloyl-ACP methyl ester carboxylesterase